MKLGSDPFCTHSNHGVKKTSIESASLSNNRYSMPLTQSECAPHIQTHIVFSNYRTVNLLSMTKNLNKSRKLFLVINHITNVIPNRTSISEFK